MDGRSRNQIAESLLDHSYEHRSSLEQNGEDKHGENAFRGRKQKTDCMNYAKGDHNDGAYNGATNGHAKKADFHTYTSQDQEVLRLLGQYLQNLGLTYVWIAY